jgi:hypothetical protein
MFYLINDRSVSGHESHFFRVEDRDMRQKLPMGLRGVLCGFTGVVVSTIIGSAAMASPNLVGNPSFEIPQATPGGEAGGPGATWGVYGNVYTENVTGRANLFAHDGDQVIKTFGGSSGVYQTITVVPGDTYTATGWGETSASDPRTSGTYDYGQLLVIVPGSGPGTGTFADLMIDPASPPPADVWQEATITGTVPTGVTSLTFQYDAGTNGNGSVFFDDSSFTESPVPEPASLGLIGLSVAGLLRRRRH